MRRVLVSVSVLCPLAVPACTSGHRPAPHVRTVGNGDWASLGRHVAAINATSTTTTTTEAPPAPVDTVAGGGEESPASRGNGRVSARSDSALDPPPVNHEDESPPLGGTAMGRTWECIAHYESDGNYGEKSNPNYRGRYQMGYQEWADMGGTGDPADAPPAEQDMRAQMLQSQRGWSPTWSTASLCGVG